MADELLMKDLPEDQKTFDIHGGGLDLQFPHHENELAQSKCAHPHGGFANVWMHNEMMQVEGKKMSKSLGNFFTVRDLLDEGVPGEVIRFVLLQSHYRSPMDWTKSKVQQALDELSRWRRYGAGIGFGGNIALVPGVIDFLSDDLNTAGAITAMRDFEKEYLAGASIDIGRVAEFSATVRFLGLDGTNLESLELPSYVASVFERGRLVEAFENLIHKARETRDFATADRLRRIATDAHFDVKSGRDKTYLDENLDSDFTKLREALK